ncbi:MAG: type II secretion system protein J [Massilia sp.]
MKRPARITRGFTLVELLVAISILAIVAVLGWRGLDSIVRARVALTEQMETTRGMQLAFAQMQSDCEHIASADLLDKRPFLLSADDRITLVRTVFTENEPSRLQVVAYRIVNGTLTRRESVATRDLAQLDALWNAATTDADTTAPVALQPGVVGMAVLTWQNNSWRQGAQTVDNTANTNNPLVPSALAPTGLQVALRATGAEAPMIKSFLLGGP